MLARSINRGVSKRAPSCLLPSRGISNWRRQGWPRWRDEADEEWKQFQLKMDAFHKQIEADPYEAIFGRSNELLRGLMRTPPVHSSPEKPASGAEARNAAQPSPASDHETAVELSYDPITGRMAPRFRGSDSAAVEDASIHYSQKHHDPRDDSLSAYERKQRNTAAQSKDQPLQKDLTQSFAPDEARTATNAAEHDQLQESLAKYDRLVREQPQRPPAPPSEWLVQEDRSKLVSRKPDLPEDDIDLLTAADVRARMGIRKNPASETTEERQRRRVQLEDAFDSIEAHDPSPEIHDALSKIREAREIYDTRKRLMDAYAAAERTEVPSEQRSSGEPDPPLSSTRRSDDGYSLEPTGLQTSFERERDSGRDLAADIQARTNPQSYIVDDGYAKEPMGLETAFETEKASGRSLADEINARTDPNQYLVNDGYSREPIGLQTSYQRERESDRSLEQDIQARDNARLVLPEDGYSHDCIGLQSSFARELDAVRNGVKKSLEQELSEMSLGAASYSTVCSPGTLANSTSCSASEAARAPPRSVEQRRKQTTAPDEIKDWYGYSLKPLGLQTSYEREIEACQRGQRKSLEEELQGRTGVSDRQGQASPREPVRTEIPTQRGSGARASDSKKSFRDQLAVPVDGGAVETMSTREEAAEIKAAAQEHHQHGVSLPRQVREVCERHYGKVTANPRQANGSAIGASSCAASGTDDALHRSLSSYDKQHPDAYSFCPDDLESQLSETDHSLFHRSQTPPSGASAIETPSNVAAVSDAGESRPLSDSKSKEAEAAAAIAAKPRSYKLLAFDPTTRSLITSQTSSTVHSAGEHPIPLSIALSQLSQPAKFIPQLGSLQKDGYEPVASTANLLILRLRDDRANKETHKRAPRPNPIDGTTIPLPPTPTMSPTGYINLDPVMEHPATARRPSFRRKDEKKVRKTEPVFSGERRKEGSKGQSVRTVLTTLIWATATCYVAGVAGEVARGY